MEIMADEWVALKTALATVTQSSQHLNTLFPFQEQAIARRPCVVPPNKNSKFSEGRAKILIHLHAANTTCVYCGV